MSSWLPPTFFVDLDRQRLCRQFSPRFLLPSNIHAKKSGQIATCKRPHSLLKKLFFSACSTRNTPPRIPAPTTTLPALPRNRPWFRFSVFPKTGNPARPGWPDFENISRSFGRLGRGRGARPLRRYHRPAHRKTTQQTEITEKKREIPDFFPVFRKKWGLPKPQHPCAPRPTCRPGTDAGHRRPTPIHVEPHGEHRDGIARASARTRIVRGTHPPFLIVPTLQRGNAVEDAPASVFFRRHGMFSLHPRLPGRRPRARGPAPARADHGLRCRRGAGGAGNGEVCLAAACGRSLRSAW